METSFFIIKPHGLIIRDMVITMIKTGGLIITESKNLILPDWALKIIYWPIKTATAAGVIILTLPVIPTVRR